MDQSIEIAVKKCAKQFFNIETPIDQIDPEESLAKYGMSSVSMFKLIVCIEEIFRFEFDEQDLVLKNFKTINSIVNSIHKYICDKE